MFVLILTWLNVSKGTKNNKMYTGKLFKVYQSSSNRTQRQLTCGSVKLHPLKLSEIMELQPLYGHILKL